MSHKIFKAIAASPGIALGRHMLLGRAEVAPSKAPVLAPEGEWECFLVARNTVEGNISDLKTLLSQRKGSVESLQMLDAQHAFLHDPFLSQKIKDEIFKKGNSAPWSVLHSFQEMHAILSKVSQAHIAEKVADLEAIKDLLMEALLGTKNELDAHDYSGAIVSAHLFTPQEVVGLAAAGAVGLVSETGSRTSHVAILSRNLNIPAVLGVEKFTRSIPVGTNLALDGAQGCVEVAPPQAVIDQYLSRHHAAEKREHELFSKAFLPSLTKNGIAIRTLGNVESSGDISLLSRNHADGVGLFRLEFFYIHRRTLPSEQEIHDEVMAIANAFPTREITVRLLDAGADKEIPSLGRLSSHMMKSPAAHLNPAMGLRGSRILMAFPELLHTQCRALVRANIHGNIRIMAPFVISIEEIRAVQNSVNCAWQELATTVHPPPPRPQVGIMVELPAAVAMADLFALEVDFFSIGTNDLTQHTLAVDRADPSISSLFEPLHPAVLRFIAQTIDSAQKAGIEVSMCGEMALDPLSIELLIGLGLTSLSGSPKAIPAAREIIRSLDSLEAQRLASDIFTMSSATEIRNHLLSRFDEKFRRLDFEIF
jgi:phosphoenolpyruvate-protein phosphotransferase